MNNAASAEQKSERELVISRVFRAPARLVFDAWTKPELLKRWWKSKSMGMSLVGCTTDVRVGGAYRFEMGNGKSPPRAFFGKYTDVVPARRLVWTNEESPDGAVTTVTLEEKADATHFVMHELYPSKDARDGALEGMENVMSEMFSELDELLKTL
jgi:uncharacterized protein YndB with AHSA1/START domain